MTIAVTALSHFSRQPVDTLHRVGQPPPRVAHGKPVGLWLSVDGEDDWPSWCKSEDFDGCGPWHYRVHVAAPDRLLWLRTPAALRRFAAERLVATEPEIIGPAIDWEAVACQWAGLVIAPYQWECRLAHGMSWYYGWDCASGCIWDPEACGASLELLSAPAAEVAHA